MTFKTTNSKKRFCMIPSFSLAHFTASRIELEHTGTGEKQPGPTWMSHHCTSLSAIVQMTNGNVSDHHPSPPPSGRKPYALLFPVEGVLPLISTAHAAPQQANLAGAVALAQQTNLGHCTDLLSSNALHSLCCTIPSLQWCFGWLPDLSRANFRKEGGRAREIYYFPLH